MSIVSGVQAIIVVVGILIIFVYQHKRTKPRFIKVLWSMIFANMLVNVSIYSLV